MDATKLGKFISELRIEKNLTQEELANKLGVSSGKIISKWEKGYTFPDFDMLIKLSEVLDVTLYELSVCEKLKKKSLIEATKHKIKSSKDILKFNIEQKITIFIAIIIAIIFALCTIYTIDNYNTIKIYELESIDDNFSIRGNFVNTKDYSIFNIINLGMIEDNKTKYNIIVSDIEYEILDDSYRVLIYNKKLNNENNKIEKQNLLENINTLSFMQPVLKENLPKNMELIFRIKYVNNKSENEFIDFRFKLLKKFANTL